jgi:hypothetical protein
MLSAWQDVVKTLEGVKATAASDLAPVVALALAQVLTGLNVVVTGVLATVAGL